MRWAYSCSKRGIDTTPRLAALNTLSLNAQNCRAMVTQNWIERRRFVSGVLRKLPDAAGLQQLAPEELLPYCPS